MAKPFRQLRNRMSEEAREKVDSRAKKLIEEVKAIKRLREIRGLTQTDLAQVLQTSQANVSKIERQTDLYLSTLRKYIQGIGGDLEIHVRFPEGHYVIDWFQEQEEQTELLRKVE
jgi:transcriptional regulator with XRE-family HTH domain